MIYNLLLYITNAEASPSSIKHLNHYTRTAHNTFILRYMVGANNVLQVISSDATSAEFENIIKAATVKTTKHIVASNKLTNQFDNRL